MEVPALNGAVAHSGVAIPQAFSQECFVSRSSTLLNSKPYPTLQALYRPEVPALDGAAADGGVTPLAIQNRLWTRHPPRVLCPEVLLYSRLNPTLDSYLNPKSQVSYRRGSFLR